MLQNGVSFIISLMTPGLVTHMFSYQSRRMLLGGGVAVSAPQLMLRAH